MVATVHAMLGGVCASPTSGVKPVRETGCSARVRGSDYRLYTYDKIGQLKVALG